MYSPASSPYGVRPPRQPSVALHHTPACLDLPAWIYESLKQLHEQPKDFVSKFSNLFKMLKERGFGKEMKCSSAPRAQWSSMPSQSSISCPRQINEYQSLPWSCCPGFLSRRISLLACPHVKCVKQHQDCFTLSVVETEAGIIFFFQISGAVDWLLSWKALNCQLGDKKRECTVIYYYASVCSEFLATTEKIYNYQSQEKTTENV